MSETQKTIPEVDVDTMAIAKRLQSLKPGETLTYQALNASVPGRILNGKDRHILASARRIACRHGVVVETISGEGVKRLENAEIAQLHQPALTKISRISRRTARKMSCADYDKLTPDEKRSYNAGIATIGTIQLFTKPQSQRVVEAAVQTAQNRISTEQTLKLFAR